MDFKFDLQMFANTISEGEYQLEYGKNYTGLIPVTVTTDKDGKYVITGTVAEQSTKTVITYPVSGVKYYAKVTNAFDTNTDTDTLIFDGIHVVSGETSKELALTSANVSDKSVLTINAAGSTKLVFLHDAENLPLDVDVKNLSADSVIHLLSGDTATTTNLKGGESVIVIPDIQNPNETNTFVSAGGVLSFVGEVNEDAYNADYQTVVTAQTEAFAAAHEAWAAAQDPDAEEPKLEDYLAQGVYPSLEEYSSTALYSGNVVIDKDDNPSVILAGATSDAADSIEVKTEDEDDGVVVKAAKGVVSSITGLDGVGATVTITEFTTDVTTPYATVTTYTVMGTDGDGTMIEKHTANYTLDGNGEPDTTNGLIPNSASTTYLDLKAGGEIFNTKAYTTAQVVNTAGVWGTDGKTDVFYHIGTSLTTGYAAADDDNLVNEANNTTYTSYAGGKFQAIAGDYYLKVNSSTSTKNNLVTTTINSFEVYRGTAAGKLSKVSTPAYNKQLDYDAAGHVIVYKKKATDQHTVKIDNADIRSTFTGLNGDTISTNAGEYTNLGNGNYTVYSGTGTTVINKVAIKGNANVTVGGADGAHSITDIRGLQKNETVTLVTTEATGTSTIVYTATEDNKINATVTAADGLKTVYTGLTVDDLYNTDLIDDLAPDDLATLATAQEIKPTVTLEGEFDWTANKSQIGYVAVGATSTTFKGGKNPTIKSSETSKDYFRIALGNLTDGVRAFSVARVRFSTDLTNPTVLTDQYTGTLNITAPAGAVSLAARPGVKTFNITNVAAGSTIITAGLLSGDSVTTGKLVLGDKVTVNGGEYYSGARNNTIKVTGDGLFSGTVWALPVTGITVGDYNIASGVDLTGAATDEAVAAALAKGSFTITANSGKTFTLGELDNGDVVTITEGNEAPVTYVKYGSYLYGGVTIDDQSGTVTGVGKMYSLGSKNSIASSALPLTAKGWTEEVTLTKDSVLGITVVDLALADKAFKALGDNPADEDIPMAFVRDKYVTTAPTAATKVAARLVDAGEYVNVKAQAFMIKQAGDQEDFAGEGVIGASANGYTHGYTANTAQSLTVTNGWEVSTAAAGDSTVTSAASGKDYINAGTGNDEITLKGAEDVVNESAITDAAGGKDTITGYAAGKDKLIVANDAKFVLSTENGADVYVTGATGAITDSYALLKGVVGKAVSISKGGNTYTDYHFGNGKKTNNKFKADTFTYVAGDYYQGNESGENTLKIGTVKGMETKTFKGDKVTVALGTEQYQNIDTADASGSANEVVLTAGAGHGTDNAVGYTLKGGTYKSTLTSGTGADTLVGGTGEDNFVMGAIEGKDTISNYTSGKDTITVGAFQTGSLSAKSFQAVGSDVRMYSELTDFATIKGMVNKAITVQQAVDEQATDYNKLTVYVGQQGKPNSFTVTSAPGVNDIYVGSDNEDTIKLSTTVTDLKADYVGLSQTTQNPLYDIPKYQGGSIDLSTDNIENIEVVDASGVKATTATLAEYGNKFVKASAGVKVEAEEVENAENGSYTGTTFIGSAYDDLFIGNTGKDTFTYSVNKGNDTFDNFSVGDVINLNGLSQADIDSLSTGIAVDNGTATINFSAGGSVTVNTTAGNLNLSYDKTSKQYQLKGSNFQ